MVETRLSADFPYASPRPSHPLRMWALNVLIWTFIGLIFVARYYFFSQAEGMISFSWKHAFWVLVGWWMWIPLTPVVLLLARRFPLDRQDWLPGLSIHILGWVLISMVDVLLYNLLRGSIAFAQGYAFEYALALRHTFIASFSLDLLVYTAIVAVMHAAEYYRRYREREVKTSQLEAQLAKARFQALEMQLHPHFLFNTLHAVSTLMGEDTRAAQHMLALLSELLRRTLDHAEAQEISLREEIEIVRRYLEIQQIRFRDRLEVAIEVPSDTLDAQVPNLILQPLLENALLHGAAPAGTVSRLRISACRRAGLLVLAVCDNGPGMPEAAQQNRGIGLRNTEARLYQLYGEAYTFTLENQPGAGLRATVTFPFYTAAEMLEAIH